MGQHYKHLMSIPCGEGHKINDDRMEDNLAGEMKTRTGSNAVPDLGAAKPTAPTYHSVGMASKEAVQSADK